MSPPGPNPQDPTREAVALAASALADLDRRSHVFLEEREDVRIRIATDGTRECSRTKSRGAAVVGHTTAHRADPDLNQLVSMAAVAAGRNPPPGGRIAGRPAEREPSRLGSGLLDEAAAWLEATASEQRRGPAVRVEVRLVQSSQTIWVGRPMEPVAGDIRAGWRIELRAACRSDGRNGTATAEAALGPAGSFPPGIVDGVIRRARERTASRPASGRWSAVPAILAPSIAGVVVHELVGHALEGDVVAGRSSKLARLLEGRLPKELTVIDDPSSGRVPWTIDDEGTQARSVVLVEGGRVTGVLHDLRTAQVAGVESTGHGRRGSYLDPILPRLGCTYAARGTEDPRSILEGTANGVYLRRIVAADVDSGAGVATFLVTDADIVEQGRLTYPLDPFPIVLDLDESLQSLDAIGNDLEFDRCVGSCVRDGQPVAVSVGAPTIRLGVIQALL